MHYFQFAFILENTTDELINLVIKALVFSLDFEDIDYEYELFGVDTAYLDEIDITSNCQATL